MAVKKKKFLIIDAHALIHRAYHALPSLTSPKGDVVGAVYGFTSVLIKVLKELKPDYVAAAFDLPGPTFRHKEFKEYKGTRPETPDDLKEQFNKIRDVVSAFGIPVLDKKEYEADDIIGSLVKKHLKKEKEKGQLDIIVLSGDLDTLQLVDDHTRVYTFRKGFSDTVTYNEAAVRQRYGIAPSQLADFKGLKGDPSDNIPGVPGVGDKTASLLIQQFGSIENMYKKLDEASVSERLKQILAESKDQAFFSKQLATIHTNVSFPFSISRAEWPAHYRGKELRGLFQQHGFFSLLKRSDELFKGRKYNIEESSSKTLVASEPSSKKGGSPGEFLKKEKRVVLDFTFDGEGGGKVAAHALKQTAVLDIETKETKEFLQDPHIKKIVYDLKSILKELWKRNLGIRGVESDIMIMAYVVSPGERDYSIERLEFLYLGADYTGRKKSEVLSFLFSVFEKKLARAQLVRVFQEIEMPLVRILAKMEISGIRVSVPKLHTLSREISKDIAILTRKIHAAAGGSFNINSPGELRTVLFDKLHLSSLGLKKTPTGLISTSAGDLESLASLHKIIPLILDYREVFKLKSTYIDALPKLVDRHTKRIHTTFNQTGTATGRLSSSDPNLQNIPRRGSWAKKIRSAFFAERGYTFVSFDYSQIELRIIAHLSRDPHMLEAFSRDEDIHTFTASLVYGVDSRYVDKTMRDAAKTLNFGMIYGISANRIARSLGIEAPEARAFLKSYFQHFEGVAKFIESTKERVRELGYSETMFGRRRYLPEIHSPSHELRAQAERMAVNMTAQGANADLIKMAMIRIDQYLDESGAGVRLMLQIHDDLLFEIKRDIVKTMVPEIRRIMETIHTFSVPLKVDIMVGSNWGNMVSYKGLVQERKPKA